MFDVKATPVLECFKVITILAKASLLIGWSTHFFSQIEKEVAAGRLILLVVLLAQLVWRLSWRWQTAGGGSIPCWSASKIQVHRTMPQSINGRRNEKKQVVWFLLQHARFTIGLGCILHGFTTGLFSVEAPQPSKDLQITFALSERCSTLGERHLVGKGTCKWHAHPAHSNGVFVTRSVRRLPTPFLLEPLGEMNWADGNLAMLLWGTGWCTTRQCLLHNRLGCLWSMLRQYRCGSMLVSTHMRTWSHLLMARWGRRPLSLRLMHLLVTTSGPMQEMVRERMTYTRSRTCWWLKETKSWRGTASYPSWWSHDQCWRTFTRDSAAGWIPSTTTNTAGHQHRPWFVRTRTLQFSSRSTTVTWASLINTSCLSFMMMICLQQMAATLTKVVSSPRWWANWPFPSVQRNLNWAMPSWWSWTPWLTELRCNALKSFQCFRALTQFLKTPRCSVRDSYVLGGRSTTARAIQFGCGGRDS